MKQILQLLEKDARLTTEQMAVMLNCSEDEIKAEMDRLENEALFSDIRHSSTGIKQTENT